METLFSFELLVDTIQMDIEAKVSGELAVALRLLDFPTLIIHQPQHKDVNEKQYAFNRGKACFFKMNINVLRGYLTSTPLYTMVLDVKEEIPKFIGSSPISLAKVMDRINQDVAKRGVSTPSSHGRRGTVGISNLKGEKVGTISLSYKLLSLGSSLMHHVVDKVDSKSMDASLKDKIDRKEADELRVNSDNLHKSDQGEDGKLSNCEECKKTETNPSKHQQIDTYGEDGSVFCPPQLYYNNSVQERERYEEESRTLLESNSNTHKFDAPEDEVGPTLPLKEQRANGTSLSEEKQQVSAGGVTPNVIGQAIRQMPLLNALLVELSQLNPPNVSRPLTVHPNLSWIYRPASTEPTAVERPQKESQNKPVNVANPMLKEDFSPRLCSTPIQAKRKSTPRKKLVYGTTKSFHLRLRQNFPVAVKQRECMELLESKRRHNTSKEMSKSVKKVTRSAKKSAQSSKLTENIEMMQNITVDSTPRVSIIEKQRKIHVAVKAIGTPHGDTSFSEKNVLIESPSRQMHIPADAESDDRVKIDQSSPDSRAGKCSGSRSGRSSADPSLSDRSRGEEDYADDFNSFETSEVFSPDPKSPSPEPRRPKTPPDLQRSSNSSPDNVQKNHRPLMPVPIKASRSPQRALRGTFTIPRQTFGVSFSSEDGDTGRTSSKLSAYLEKRDDGREGRSSGDSMRSVEDHRRESKSGQSIKSFPEESSSEHKTEEEDELGTLDFKKCYKHISELVANKLPGYTM